MNRRLQVINLAGVLALAVLCAIQWQRDRRLNLDLNRAEKVRLEQEAKIAEQQRSILGLNDDLALFKEQLTESKAILAETRERLWESETAANQLLGERDQLRESIAVWTNAVAERDARLTEANDRISEMADRLNVSVRKFNELATNYNQAIEALNHCRTNPPATGARRP